MIKCEKSVEGTCGAFTRGTKMDIFSVLKLMLGLTFFLFGMKVMSENLEKISGGKLEQLLKKATANPFVSLFLGAVITIAVQSSSATTVMLVGLVNSGIMQFSQTIYVIFGANIGTTLTAWIISMSSITSDSILIAMLKPENFSPIIAFIGIIMVMFSKKDKRRTIGTIFVGFAVLMYGMEFMTDAVSPLADLPGFDSLLVKFSNPILGVLVGTLFTAIIQSSAASVAILQALSLTGGITYGMAIPIIMGQNIGTCATSLISCIGTNAKAKRVAFVHLSINVIGTVICLSAFELLRLFVPMPFVDIPVNPISIAVAHSIFNILITAILMPCTKLLTRMTEFVIKDDSEKEKEENRFKLDELILRSPSVAVVECDNYTSKMSEIAYETLMDAFSLLEKYDPEVAERVDEHEKIVDAYEDNLGTFLVKLSPHAVSTSDSRRISKMLHVIGNFERLSDHAVNLKKVALEIDEKHIVFSEKARRELKTLTEALTEILTITTKAYETNDVELAARVEPLEQVIDSLISTIKVNHIERLQHGVCTIELGFVLSDLLTNYERISDHCSNVAVAIIEVVHDSFDTHKYLNGVKYGDADFNTLYDLFRHKYAL